MSDITMEDLVGLSETGYEAKEQVSPEDEFFHSIYIAGRSRKNHQEITEEAGKMQIRGVDYNLDKIYMIITHVKQVLARVSNNPVTKRDSLDCFSYQQGDPPWVGISIDPSTGKRRVCGVNSAERAANDYCKECRAQLIMAGIYCSEKGVPVTVEDENGNKKAIFVFIRGKGMKYSNVSDYLAELSKMELDPILKPETPETRKTEKAVINNKRFVTEITVGEAQSNYGPKSVFEFNTGEKLSNDSVMYILKVAKKTLDKFTEKFDWSNRKVAQSSGYTGEQQGPTEEQTFPTGESKEEKTKEEKPTEQQDISFEDIDF